MLIMTNNIVDIATRRNPAYNSYDRVMNKSNRHDIWTMRTAVIGGIAVAVALGISGVRSLTAPSTERVRLEFGPGSSDWTAAQELAKVEGQNPSNRQTVTGIDNQLLAIEGSPDPIDSVVSNGQIISLNIPVAEKYQHSSKTHGFGVTLHFLTELK